MKSKENSVRQLAVRQCYATSQDASKSEAALRDRCPRNIEINESTKASFRSGIEMCFAYWDNARKEVLLGEAESTSHSLQLQKQNCETILNQSLAWGSDEAIAFSVGCLFALNVSLDLLSSASVDTGDSTKLVRT